MPAGRPTKMTPECIKKLEQAFACDMNDLQACQFAGITDQTLDNYEKKHPEFLGRKKLIRENIKVKAKMNVAQKVEDGDYDASKWVLERRDEDYKPKQKSEVEVSGHKSLIDAILAEKGKK